MAFAHVP